MPTNTLAGKPRKPAHGTYPMEQRRCACGLRIYQFNFACVGCGRAIGNCGHCHTLTSFDLRDNQFFCTRSECGANVQPCSNRANNAVCNAMMIRDTESEVLKLCEFCEMTTVIPPLDNPQNLIRWRKLEAAKRQLHAQLRSLGLPPYEVDPSLLEVPPLSYDFVERAAATEDSPIMMGHQHGKITIVAEEADAGYREGLREQLGEPQRTLVRHFRHEIGHYIDLVGIPEERRPEYIELFGDPMSLDYGVAKDNYYAQAADGNHWQAGYVSKYSTMHPWEDFAETVDAFLDLAAVIQVACDHNLLVVKDCRELCSKPVIEQYRELALLSNELNFSRGLEMLVPEIINEPVRRKLEFVASLCQA